MRPPLLLSIHSPLRALRLRSAAPSVTTALRATFASRRGYSAAPPEKPYFITTPIFYVNAGAYCPAISYTTRGFLTP